MSVKNRTELKADLDSAITSNNTGGITGNILNDWLTSLLLSSLLYQDGIELSSPIGASILSATSISAGTYLMECWVARDTTLHRCQAKIIAGTGTVQIAIALNNVVVLGPYVVSPASILSETIELNVEKDDSLSLHVLSVNTDPVGWFIVQLDGAE